MVRDLRNLYKRDSPLNHDRSVLPNKLKVNVVESKKIAEN
jgi:hypothetical protein